MTGLAVKGCVKWLPEPPAPPLPSAEEIIDRLMLKSGRRRRRRKRKVRNKQVCMVAVGGDCNSESRATVSDTCFDNCDQFEKTSNFENLSKCSISIVLRFGQ